MADIRAFRGYRYDLGKVGSLSDVICPPYDVIDAELQEKLYAASDYNAIRLELTQDRLGDTESENKYTRAASTLKDWTNDDVMSQDTSRCLYFYEQEFQVDSQTFTRRGFLTRVRLEPFGTGRIFPHEQTLSGPKADRLKLYNATHFNISPVFGLYPDDGEVFQLVDPLIRNQPPMTAKDHLGVTNRLWVVNDSAVLSKIMGLLGPKPIFIADGHHRYETGLAYANNLREEGRLNDEEAPANFCLMMLVGMSDPGLLILPTHRLVSGLNSVSGVSLEAALREHFEIIETFDNSEDCWEHVQLEDSQDVLGFGTVTDGKWLVARLTDESIMGKLAPDQSSDWRSLAVSILHKVVLEKLLPAALGGTPSCQYVHLMKEVDEAVSAKSCQLVCLVPPCGMEHVESIAGNREKMPPKSTYFYPKIVTGLVLHSLKKD